MSISQQESVLESTENGSSVATKKETEEEKKARINLVDVVQHGEKLIVPSTLKLEEAIEVLQRQIAYESQTVAVREDFQAAPYDGAVALQKALAEVFGWVGMKPSPPRGFFDMESPPMLLTIPVSATETLQVPWGVMHIPQMGGYLMTDVTKNNEGRFVFRVSGEVLRKHEQVVVQIGHLVRKYLKSDSIYRGKAIRIRFRDDAGAELPMPEPKFIDLRNVKEEELILAADVEAAVRTSIFTPLERTAECREHGIPLKRGILLAGPFGTGKTLTAYVTAKKAQDNGWTFLYCEKATELAEAMRFGQQYAPAVVFCEDIDRVTQERNERTNALLNTIDGIDAKDTDLMVVLTTNHIESIEQALLRPGRLDAVIPFGPPDAKAAEQLARVYGRSLILDTENLRGAGEALKGNIPSVIREVVERSKLTAIRMTPKGQRLNITNDALVEASTTMNMHKDLLTPKPEDNRSNMEKAAEIIQQGIVEAAHKQVGALVPPDPDAIRSQEHEREAAYRER